MKRKTAILHRLSLILFLIVSLFPIFWMLSTSFKHQSEVYSKVPSWIPQVITTNAYKYLFTETDFLNSTLNSFIVAIVVASLTIVLAYPVAYALGRINFRGRQILSRIILFCYLLPAAIMYLPLYNLVSDLGLTNTIWGLILIYPTFTLPYATWILIPAVRSVPIGIEEAATVDGCSRVKCMYQIVLPLIKPSVVTTFIFCFAQCWGEYLYALVNITDSRQKTFPLIISGLIFGDIYPWHQIMAGAIVACLPILLIYLISSRFVVSGATSGAVKA